MGIKPCQRCRSTSINIYPDGVGYVFSCRERPCMKKDAEISGKIAIAEMDERTFGGKQRPSDTCAKLFNIGHLYSNATLAKIIAPDNAIEMLNRWAKSTDKLLLIQGSPGTGKTFICAAVLNYLFDQKKEVFYTNHRRFIAKIQEGFTKDYTQDYSVNLFAYKDILIFDDLGAATNTDWQQETILDLIDKRVSMKKKTLFTTNLNNWELSDILGARTASRLLARDNLKIELWTTDLRKENIDTDF